MDMASLRVLVLVDSVGGVVSTSGAQPDE